MKCKVLMACLQFLQINIYINNIQNNLIKWFMASSQYFNFHKSHLINKLSAFTLNPLLLNKIIKISVHYRLLITSNRTIHYLNNNNCTKIKNNSIYNSNNFPVWLILITFHNNLSNLWNKHNNNNNNPNFISNNWYIAILYKTNPCQAWFNFKRPFQIHG
jgi:hypothetical protein